MSDVASTGDLAQAEASVITWAQMCNEFTNTTMTCMSILKIKYLHG